MKNHFIDRWPNLNEFESQSFICWNCGEKIASNKGFISLKKHSKELGAMTIYICHNCNAPNVYDSSRRPICSALQGKEIKKLPKPVEDIYNEARACMSVCAYTATVMLLRKILMNLAVVNGAKEGLKFIEYVDYLCRNGFVHRKQTKQADIVRTMGNDANHQIENKTQQEAEQIFKFVELLLLNNYEFADEEDENET